MQDIDYKGTFVQVAPDCPVTEAVVPEPRGGKKTIAVIQYEMLIDAPYQLTQSDVLFGTYATKQGIGSDELKANGPSMRDEYFSVGRACMRASPLTKKYGWGVHFDTDGMARLVPLGSKEYTELASDEGLRQLLAMRSKRAKV